MKKNFPVLFCGDINVDLILGNLSHQVQEDKEVSAETYSRTVGSSSVITSFAYSSLGGSSSVSGLRGRDDNGLYMESKMKEFGVDSTLVQLSDKTATGITVNLIYGRSRSQVTYPGTIAEFAGPDLNLSYKEYSHIHFTGIYQQTSFLPHLLETARFMKSQGLSISLDTQWDAHERWEHLDELYPLLDILFINEDEGLSISKSNTIDKAIHYFRDKTAMTVLKMGSRGAYIITRDKEHFIPIYPAVVVDTIGAGDTFAAAFIYSLNILEKNPIESGHFASAASARSCQFPGGVNAKSTCNDILTILENNNAQF